MKKRDVFLIFGIAALACALLAVGLMQRGRLAVPTAQGAGNASALSEAYSEAVRAAVTAYFDAYPAESYVVLETQSGVHTPVPLNDENEFRVTQADGSENVVHIGRNSFYMAFSNCENQNCVQQGEVTLENRDTRVLFNMVICMPHNLSLQLVTRAEAEALLAELYAQAEAEGASFGAENNAA